MYTKPICCLEAGLQKVEGVVVVRLDEDGVGELIQVPEGLQQPALEFLAEVAGVHGEGGVRQEELERAVPGGGVAWGLAGCDACYDVRRLPRWPAADVAGPVPQLLAGAVIGLVSPLHAGPLACSSSRLPVRPVLRPRLPQEPEAVPLGPLFCVGGDLGQEARADVLITKSEDGGQRDAVLRVHHELLLPPQFLLEVFDLGEEVNDLQGDLADDLDLPEVLLHKGGRPVHEVVHLQDLVLEVEVQLPPEEAAQVLVDEVVEGVACRVAPEVRLQPRVAGRPPIGQDVFPAQLLNPGGQGRVFHAQHPRHGDGDQFLLRRGLRPPLSRRPVGGGGRPVLEPDDQLPVLLGDEVPGRQHEGPVLRRLHVPVLALGGIHQGEVHPHGMGLVVGAEPEGVIPQVLAGLDVVLVAVYPVQPDLLALVGQGVDALPVDAPWEEVSLRVVAAEEAVELVVDFRLQRSPVGDAAPQVRRMTRVVCRRCCRPGRLDPLLPGFRPACNARLAERLPDQGRQAPLQEVSDLVRPGAQDAVDSEVQVGLVELKELQEERFQPIVLLFHALLLRWRCRPHPT